MKRFAAGCLIGLLAPAAALLFAAWRGWLPVEASERPPIWEHRIAHAAFDAAVERRAPRASNPVAPTEEELTRGLALYRNDCAGCHGEPGRPSSWGSQFYPPVPQFGKLAPGKPDWQIAWIIRNGVRYSGMGGWAGQIPDRDVWRLATFLSRLDALPPSVDASWRNPPKP